MMEAVNICPKTILVKKLYFTFVHIMYKWYFFIIYILDVYYTYLLDKTHRISIV